LAVLDELSVTFHDTLFPPTIGLINPVQVPGTFIIHYYAWFQQGELALYNGCDTQVQCIMAYFILTERTQRRETELLPVLKITILRRD